MLFYIIILLTFLPLFNVHAGDYLDSAHGNTTYGVKRNETNLQDYARGNCAHCHEQHASINGVSHDPRKYLLFGGLFTNQSTAFCFKCHKDPSISKQTSMPYQYSYSVIHGGESPGCPDDIKEAFRFLDDSANPRTNCNSNSGSAHFLEDIKDFIKNKWGWGPGRTVNPCSGCHNPHKAKKDYPCSKPTDHENTWEVWGDETDERMSSWSEVYQPPYKVPDSDFEWQDAASAPDYVTFCLDCHENEVYSTRYNVNLDAIWLHGRSDYHLQDHDGSHSQGKLRKPYSNYDTSTTNFIVMCTDCHEPHGSKSYMLLRTRVNGTDVGVITNYDDDTNIITFCGACHKSFHNPGGCLGPPGVGANNWGCHNHDHIL